jgi:glycosyltransferase involved in cell wall biosynthesis
VLSQSNQGAAAARNTALALASGDYIQWLDADDLLALDKIGRQLERPVAGRPGRTLLSSAFGRFLYRPKRATFTPTALWCDLTASEWLMRKMEQNLYMQTSTWLVPRELSDAVGAWDTGLAVDDDGEYFSRMLLASDGVCFVREARVYYRISGHTSLSYVGRSSRKLEAQWRSMELHMAYLRSLDDSARARNACVRYMEHWLPYFHPLRPDIIERAAALARTLGGQLGTPRRSWKYSCLSALAGDTAASAGQRWVGRARSRVARAWDRTLADLERLVSGGEPLRF